MKDEKVSKNLVSDAGVQGDLSGWRVAEGLVSQPLTVLHHAGPAQATQLDSAFIRKGALRPGAHPLSPWNYPLNLSLGPLVARPRSR